MASDILRVPRRAYVALAATLALAHGAGARGGPATLAVAGRSNDNVSIAASGDFVAVAWSAAKSGATDIYASASRDGGATFSAPVRVNAVPGEARVSGEMPPRVALVPRAQREPEVVVVWTATKASDWRLLVARSTDGAHTFGATSVVTGSDAVGSRGWQSVTVDPRGRVVVAWLDHRELAARRGGATRSTPQGMSESEAKAGLSQLYVATLGGDAARGVAGRGIAARGIARSVCYCCKTSLVASGSDIYAVWRHVFPGNERDIALAVSRDGGRRFAGPVRVSADRWRFDGCPDNGPALAIDRDKRAHVAWVTPVEGGDPSHMVLYHAVTRDGHTFTPRTRVPVTGLPGHPQLTTEPNGTIVMAWDEIAEGARRVKLARAQVDAAGKASFTPLPSPEAGEGDHPVVTITAGGTVMAWVRRMPTGGESTIGVARIR